MNEVHQVINSVLGVVSLLTVLWLSAVKITKLEVKVDTMWGMLLKRAVVEGVQLGVLGVNSPVRLINHSGAMLEVMAGELREIYEKEWKNLSEEQIALEIEKKFGDRLVKEVCIPNNISYGVCLLIATAIAKNTETLEEILARNLPAKP